tara:strand:+ start:59 stop:262 length:204 start_codon:yes stop_codon:yes gene_type:complete
MGQYKNLFIDIEECLGDALDRTGMTNEQAINYTVSELANKKDNPFGKDTIRELTEEVMKNWEEEFSK